MPNTNHRLGTQQCFFDQTKSKNRIVKESLSIEIPTNVHFEIREESNTDKFFKWLGICEEFSTKDSEFDSKFFIACDHFGFLKTLETNDKLRYDISKIFAAGANSISLENNILTVIKNSPGVLNGSDHIESFFSKMRPALEHLGSRFSDRFVKTTLVIETIVWCIIGYAVNVYVEAILSKNDIYINKYPLLVQATLIGIAAFTTLNILFWLALKGSSRAHRVLIFSVVTLTMALPVSCYQLISDYNRSQDDSFGVSVVREVKDGRIIEYRSRKRRKSYSYHLYFDSQSLPLADKEVSLPTEMQVDSEIYRKAMATRKLEISVKRGKLGFPWYESIGDQSMEL